VPETAVPETAVPETAVPETAVPETAVPETGRSMTESVPAIGKEPGRGEASVAIGAGPVRSGIALTSLTRSRYGHIAR
jgi:tRNA (guanine-N7-)-methyltransferase